MIGMIFQVTHTCRLVSSSIAYASRHVISRIRDILCNYMILAKPGLYMVYHVAQERSSFE